MRQENALGTRKQLSIMPAVEWRPALLQHAPHAARDRKQTRELARVRSGGCSHHSKGIPCEISDLLRIHASLREFRAPSPEHFTSTSILQILGHSQSIVVPTRYHKDFAICSCRHIRISYGSLRLRVTCRLTYRPHLLGASFGSRPFGEANPVVSRRVV